MTKAPRATKTHCEYTIHNGNSILLICGIRIDALNIIPTMSTIPDPITKKCENLDSSDILLVKIDSAIPGAREIKITWINELDGSTVVCGPNDFGPIKKLKKDIEINTNKTSKPNTAIESHSPVLNIYVYLNNRYILF